MIHNSRIGVSRPASGGCRTRRDDLAHTLSIADRGYVLQNGSIALSGKASDLLDDPAVQRAYLGQRVA